ncbi:hypothetical protein BDV93DRAFT_581196 [Ceratobasidium sp. AG-I]|nr:hypothetical protein BDV93DRAFT_581196 [Ceratobasidium sp. AG-I]
MSSGAYPLIQHHNLHQNAPHEMVFSQSDEKVEGPVVDWCLSSGNLHIRRMEMHSTRNSPPRYFVSFTLDNNVIFLFERVTGASGLAPSSSGGNTHHDMVTTVLEGEELRSNSIVVIEFHKGVSDGLLLPLTICHRIQRTDWKTCTPNSRAFAWMLTMLVTRKHIPPVLDFATCPSTPLEELCSCIYSDLQFTGKSVWEADFRAEIQNAIQRQIFLALHEQIQSSTSTHAMLNNYSMKRVVVSSLICWVKFLATYPDRNILSIWDTAWDRAWSKEWARAWEHEGGTQDNLILGVKVGVGRTTTPKTGGTRISGRAAGRAPTDFKRVQQAITGEQPISTVSHGALQRLGAGIRTNSRRSSKSNNTVPKKVHARPKKDWLEEWCHIHYPETGPAWRPAWETAAEAAWATVWRAAEELRAAQAPGATSIPVPRMTFRGAAETVIALLPTKRQAQHSTATEERAEENKKLAETIVYGLRAGVVEPLAEEALKREELQTSYKSNMILIARQTFSSAKKSDNRILPTMKRISEDDWIKMFSTAWKTAWKRSWMAAWLAVWDNVGEEARRSGIEDEDPPRQDPTINDAMLAAYRNIRFELSRTSQRTADDKNMRHVPETNGIRPTSQPQAAATNSTGPPPIDQDTAYALQQAGLMFKELTHLNHLISKSVPTPHQEIMNIFFGCRMRYLKDHKYLQQRYKKYLKETIPQEHYQQHLRDIAHVWETAFSRAPNITSVEFDVLPKQQTPQRVGTATQLRVRAHAQVLRRLRNDFSDSAHGLYAPRKRQTLMRDLSRSEIAPVVSLNHDSYPSNNASKSSLSPCLSAFSKRRNVAHHRMGRSQVRSTPRRLLSSQNCPIQLERHTSGQRSQAGTEPCKLWPMDGNYTRIRIRCDTDGGWIEFAQGWIGDGFYGTPRYAEISSSSSTSYKALKVFRNGFSVKPGTSSLHIDQTQLSALVLFYLLSDYCNYGCERVMRQGGVAGLLCWVYTVTGAILECMSPAVIRLSTEASTTKTRPVDPLQHSFI